ENLHHHDHVVGDAGDGWPDPLEVPSESNILTPVPVLPPELLPEPFRHWLADVAARAQVPLEYPAVAALVAAGILIGGKLGIKPKRHDHGWLVVPNLWGAIVGPPGVLKSPMLSEGLAPLRILESEAQDAHELAVRDYDVESTIAEVRRDVLR